jgi:Uma2 family endonuclease
MPESYYELSDGHPIQCQPSGPRHGSSSVTGALPIATDPGAFATGFDVGYALDAKTVRAPDLSVGAMPDDAGWVDGCPALAVEYADRGQDPADLRRKISELLARGTKYVWVVHLTGRRRVVVHEKDQPPRLVTEEEYLEAPGVLSRKLPVRALYDREVANQHTLENLLRAHGYDSLDDVRKAGIDEGRRSALVQTILDLSTVLGTPIPENAKTQLPQAALEHLERVRQHLVTHRRWPDE